MEHHGSESYFVLGEGLLSESDAGRDGAASARAAATGRAVPPFRFSRIGPNAPRRQLDEPTRSKLAHAMVTGADAGSRIPAGFTYLGQFVDHDLTFDKTRVAFGANVPPGALLQGRSPTLDLDSLYGAGPADPVSQRFYAADGLHLKEGRTTAADGLPAHPGADLPRGAGATAAAKRRALVPDPRNDENLAVASIHRAMIRFHNRVVDTLPAAVPPAQRFAKAREIVTKHYQWMIRTDYLPRICARAVVNDVFRHGRKLFEIQATPADVPTMALEFSVAAFRLGHSMVRSAYNWNRIFDDGGGTLDLLFTFSGTSGDLGGNPTLPPNWIADYRRLFDFGEAHKPGLTVRARKFNRAMRIDTRLVNPLAHLPEGSFGGHHVSPNAPRANLAFRNLTRARMVSLATGQDMARRLRQQGVAVTPLTAARIRDGENGASLGGLTARQRDAALRRTPLWFYVLREAELNGGRLTGVGARIVAETFQRAMEGSTFSIVRDHAFHPTLGPDSKTLRMVDLLLFAFAGKKQLLAPLG